MNLENVRKCLSLILLILAIFSIFIGVSVAAGENSITDQAMLSDNSYIYNVSYSNYSYESISDSKNSLSKNDSIDNNLSLSTKSCSFNENTVSNLSNSRTLKINGNLENNLSKSHHNSLFNIFKYILNHITFVEKNSNQLNLIHLNILDHELIVFNTSNSFISYIFNKDNMDLEFVTLLLQFDKIFKQRTLNNTGLFTKNNNELSYSNNREINDFDNYSHEFNTNENFKKISKIDSLNKNNNFSTVDLSINKNLINNFSTVDLSINKNLIKNFSTVDLSINKNLQYTKNQIINSYFLHTKISKNNFKIFALNNPYHDDTSDEEDDDEEPSDSPYLANRLILYTNSLNSNGLKYTYTILDNTTYNYLDSFNSISPISLKTSIFNLIKSYSFKTISKNISLEIVDIRNDSINFGIITDYSNLLISNNHEFILNSFNFINLNNFTNSNNFTNFTNFNNSNNFNNLNNFTNFTNFNNSNNFINLNNFTNSNNFIYI